MSEPIGVLIVEDHPIYRDGLAAAFTGVDDITVVDAVGSVSEALKSLERSSVDVLLLDLGLPDGSGLDVLEAVRGSSPSTAVLVLTMADDAGVVLAAVRGGARGYLLKGAGRADLVDAVRRTYDGGSVFGALAADAVLAALTGPSPDPAASLGLTEREGEVLRLLCEGLSNSEIARRLSIAPKTARNHVSVVLTKLGAANRLEAAELGRKAGLAQ